MANAQSPQNGSLNEVDPNNTWRLETPGVEGWRRTARPDDPNKYFMVSADGHLHEPADLWKERIEDKYRERLPGITLDLAGNATQKSEGFRPIKLRNIKFEGEDVLRAMAGRTPDERLADHARDGVDAEILFPNKGLVMWATPDPEFCQAMCRVYNSWAWEIYGPYNDRLAPMACIASGDIEGAIAEVQRVAKLGYRGLCLPCKPVWGGHDHEHLNYNLPDFDPLWAAVQDADLPLTFHVSTGRDPRASRGNGGAIINYAVHSLAPTMEPVANLCASGVLARFPGLRFATIEAGIGWVPWALSAMDEAYKKHHMFVRPKLDMLPSEYFKQHGHASFQEDPAGLDLAVGHGLVDNFLWANDYPHHEGSWPHSAQAIERSMGHFTEEERGKILGVNAARLFKFEVPDRTRQFA
jgi:predicted TIM-barrel fold metal-dependent hydrolase